MDAIFSKILRDMSLGILYILMTIGLVMVAPFLIIIHALRTSRNINKGY